MIEKSDRRICNTIETRDDKSPRASGYRCNSQNISIHAYNLRLARNRAKKGRESERDLGR